MKENSKLYEPSIHVLKVVEKMWRTERDGYENKVFNKVFLFYFGNLFATPLGVVIHILEIVILRDQHFF